MKAQASVARSLQVSDEMFLDLTVGGYSGEQVHFGLLGEYAVGVNDVLRFADKKLTVAGYQREGEWVWHHGLFEVEVSKVDTTLDYKLEGRKLRDITTSEALAHALNALMNRPGQSFPAKQANWRMQQFFDGDGDKCMAVHNGDSWVVAWWNTDVGKWESLGVPTYAQSTLPPSPMTGEDYLKSFEPKEGSK